MDDICRRVEDGNTWHKTAKDGNWKKRSVFRSGYNKAAEKEEVE